MLGKKREKLDISVEEARMLIDGDIDGYTLVSNTVIDTTRWSSINEIIISRVSDNKFFRDHYSAGLTEMQDESPWEYAEPNFTEVFPKTVEVTQYV